ncbi:hypothetical protein OWR29_36775 [Actinoplanes sp. Pm04-4]|uniref:Lipoprotein n=1 Tax=Paractinoplanes pyxinae TaxID=2997416 RepID=A0ABT4BAN8_9ACTN|nr:hypothetical protein [Actinoplanes pyxinae]MCY1143587.1 hypothetical protein [Actinoplanes pyxinae]
MRTRHGIATVVVLVTVAACGSTATTATTGTGAAAPSQAPSAPATVPSDPQAAIAAAKAQLGRESARFAQICGNARLDYTGRVAAATGNWEITGKEFVVRRIGTDIYMRVSGKTLAGMPLSPTTEERITEDDWVRTPLPVGRETSVVWNDKFPWILANPASSATGVRRTGAHAFAGTQALESGVTLRVRVTLDDRGRFTSVGLSKVANEEARFTFSDFGLQADVTAPPQGEVVTENSPFLLSFLYLT